MRFLLILASLISIINSSAIVNKSYLVLSCRGDTTSFYLVVNGNDSTFHDDKGNIQGTITEDLGLVVFEFNKPDLTIKVTFTYKEWGNLGIKGRNQGKFLVKRDSEEDFELKNVDCITQ